MSTSILASSPTELVIQIYENLDLRSALSLARSCRRFYRIYELNETRLLKFLASNEKCLRGFQDCNFVKPAISLAEAQMKNKAPRGFGASRAILQNATVVNLTAAAVIRAMGHTNFKLIILRDLIAYYTPLIDPVDILRDLMYGWWIAFLNSCRPVIEKPGLAGLARYLKSFCHYGFPDRPNNCQ